MVALQSSKLTVRVRIPSLAPNSVEDYKSLSVIKRELETKGLELGESGVLLSCYYG